MLLVQNFKIQYFSYLKEYALIFFFWKGKILKSQAGFDLTTKTKDL